MLAELSARYVRSVMAAHGFDCVDLAVKLQKQDITAVHHELSRFPFHEVAHFAKEESSFELAH